MRSPVEITFPSVRAWRGLRFNEKYAARLEKQKAKEREKKLVKAKAAEEEAKLRNTVKTNPFSVRTDVTLMATNLTSPGR